MSNPYMKQQILSASVDELFVMVLNKCRYVINNKPVDTSKFIELIDYLLLALNRDIKNEFVDNLDGVLNFLMFEIIKYNTTKDEDTLINIDKILVNICDAWKIKYEATLAARDK